MSTAEAECAERVNAAVAAREAHWRAIVINKDAAIEQLEREVRAVRLELGMKAEEKKKWIPSP